MPRDADSTGGHGAGAAGVAGLPAPRPHLLDVAAHGQHGEPRLHPHALLPLPALTEVAVGGIARGGLATGIAQDHPPALPGAQAPRQGGIRDLGGGTRPPPSTPHWCSHPPRWPPTIPR